MAVIEKNKNYIIDITGMTHEAQGVGRAEGLAVFVDGVLEGEQVEVKIIKLNKSYAVGKLIKILKPSPNRTEPFCAAYKRCGGCNLQHMDYQAQLAFKTVLVRDALERVGGLKDVDVHDTIGMQKPYQYRNKAQYPVAVIDGRAITGFYAARSHEVIQSEECGIQDAGSDQIRRIISDFLIENNITVYDEKTGEGLVRHILTRTGFHTGEIMVVLVINGKEMPATEELVRRLTDGEKGRMSTSAVKSIYLNLNTQKGNVILGPKNMLLYGNETITDTIGRYKFMISPHSFFQVNPIQTEVLYAKTLEYAGLTGEETVFDLYCGIGTISLFLSESAAKVYGVEVVEAAIEDARRNAQLNDVRNAEFIAGEAERIVPQLYSRGIRADVVVLDPPRKGCEESLLQLLAEMQPDRIVYVSCNPATLARDLKYLNVHGYKVEEVQPVDMFPWSGHVEVIILLQRLKR